MISCLVISVLHALIPNHSLPIIAIGKRFAWALPKLILITLLAASAHILSTVIIGLILGMVGIRLNDSVSMIMQWVMPALLIILGIFFLWQHHTHHHFNLDEFSQKSSKKIVIGLVIAMFFSPCLEIEGVFLAAGSFGWSFLLKLIFIYTSISLAGILLWVLLAHKGLQKIDSHKIEHNIGLITGVVLILTGLAFIVMY